MRRYVAHVLLVVAATSCESTKPAERQEQPEQRAWVGSYSYFAAIANYCTEGPLYDCSCGPLGHYEGTLTLSVTGDSPSGTLEVQECKPGVPCGQPVTLPVVDVVSYAGSPAYEFGFCAGQCSNNTNNGGWSHVVEKMQPGQDSLVGTYSHADGSLRGCGSDAGDFKATRK